MPPTGDLACNPGMCPDWELNQWPLLHKPVLNPLSHTIQSYYFKKGKKAIEMQKRFVQCIENMLWLVKCVKSGLWSFSVLLTFWPNNSLLWGCLMHWKMFSSSPGLCPLEKPIAGDSRHTQCIQINKVIGKNFLKCLLFYGKTERTSWPTQ